MAIVKDPKTGKYKIIKSPKSYYEARPSSGGSSSNKTVPSNFIGPLQPGVTREPTPSVYSGPVRPGTDESTFRETGRTLTPQKTDKPISMESEIKPLSIEPYDSTTNVYSQGYGAAIAGGFSAFGRNIKQFFTGRTHEYEDVSAGFDYVDLKRDRPTSIPRFGTISDQDTGAFVTYGDIQKDIEVKRMTKSITAKGEAEKEISDIQKQYQSQIDTGSITLSEAETGLAEDIIPIQEKFKTKTADIYKETPDVPGLYTYGGTEDKKQLGAVLDIGGFTIASAFGGPLGAVGYGTARGISLASKGDPKDIRTMDMGIAKLSPESKQAGLFLGLSAISAISVSGVIGKEITQLRIAEGIKSPSISQPRIISKTDDVSRLITRSGQRTPYFETDTKTTFDIFKKGEKNFQIGSGTGKTTTRYLDFMKQGTGDYPWVSSTKSFTIAGKGGAGTIINAPEGVEAFTGNLLIGTDTGVSKIRFGGATKKVGEKAFIGVGGEVKGMRAYTLTDDAGTYFTGRTTAKVIPKDISFGKDISLSVSDDVSKGFTSFSGGGSKSSPQFFEQLYQTKQIEAIGGQATTEAMKVTTSTIQAPKISLKAPSIYAGTGMYEQMAGGTITEQMKAPQVNLVIGGLVKPTIDTLNVQEAKQSRVVVSGVSSTLIQMPRVDASIKQTSIVTPVVGQLTGQKLIQKTDLKPVSEFGIPSFTPTFTPSVTPPIGNFGIPPIPPYIPKPSFQLGKKGPTRKIVGIPNQFVGSSYSAKVFDIRSKKEAKGSFGGMFTGLEIKPLDLSGKARIRKKRTKKKKGV